MISLGPLDAEFTIDGAKIVSVEGILADAHFSTVTFSLRKGGLYWFTREPRLPADQDSALNLLAAERKVLDRHRDEVEAELVLQRLGADA